MLASTGVFRFLNCNIETSVHLYNAIASTTLSSHNNNNEFTLTNIQWYNYTHLIIHVICHRITVQVKIIKGTVYVMVHIYK